MYFKPIPEAPVHEAEFKGELVTYRVYIVGESHGYTEYCPSEEVVVHKLAVLVCHFADIVDKMLVYTLRGSRTRRPIEMIDVASMSVEKLLDWQYDSVETALPADYVHLPIQSDLDRFEGEYVIFE
jgi:hypothetical protein